jgi:DNA invertase Pin-like site-specific DNA recombinase
MFQMMGVFAEFERAMIQERVRAGLARVRSEGKRLGLPPRRNESVRLWRLLGGLEYG